MNYIAPFAGMNFNPITDYNKYIKETKALEVGDNNDFENILNQKTSQIQDPMAVEGGIAIDKANNTSPVGDFLGAISNTIGGGLNSVNNKSTAADKAQEAFAMGDDSVSVHDVMIASEKSSLSLNLAMQLRNKVLTAYNDINSIKV